MKIAIFNIRPFYRLSDEIDTMAVEKKNLLQENWIFQSIKNQINWRKNRDVLAHNRQMENVSLEANNSISIVTIFDIFLTFKAFWWCIH